jgi:hypothetical protein
MKHKAMLWLLVLVVLSAVPLLAADGISEGGTAIIQLFANSWSRLIVAIGVLLAFAKMVLGLMHHESGVGMWLGVVVGGCGLLAVQSIMATIFRV